MVPAGVALAGYTAFLFNQCEGRDLWQSPLLFPHTVANAVVAGAAFLGVAALVLGAPDALTAVLGWALALGAVTSGVIAALDLGVEHPTRQAERAARNLTHDLYARRFWLGGIGLGVAAPALLGALFLLTGALPLLALAGVVALAGLWLYEDAWVRAGQSVPLS